MAIDLNDPYRGNLLALLPLIYILPSYFMYFLVLYVMLFSKHSSKFKFNSFYQLFVMQSISNLMFSAIQYFKFRSINAALFFTLYDLIPTRSFWLTLNECLAYHSFAAQVLLDTFISFNRMTVFALKEKYKYFWKHAIKGIALFVIFFPVLNWWQLWITDVYIGLYNASNPEQGHFIGEKAKQLVYWQRPNRNMAYFIPVVSLLALVMNVYVAWNLRVRIKTTNFTTEDDKTDLKLFFFTLFLFFSQMANAFIQACFYFLPYNDPILDFAIRIQSFVTDVNCLGPLWMLLILNKYLRTSVLEFVGINFKTMQTKIGATVLVRRSSTVT